MTDAKVYEDMHKRYLVRTTVPRVNDHGQIVVDMYWSNDPMKVLGSVSEYDADKLVDNHGAFDCEAFPYYQDYIVRQIRLAEGDLEDDLKKREEDAGKVYLNGYHPTPEQIQAEKDIEQVEKDLKDALKKADERKGAIKTEKVATYEHYSLFDDKDVKDEGIVEIIVR